MLLQSSSRTAPLLAEIERALPERPFTIELWDGSRLPSSTGDGPTFTARSRTALAHVLRAPGQLGLGRAYVSGALDVDDIDALLELLRDWQPPPIDNREKARLMLAAARACGIVRPPPIPAAELRPRGRGSCGYRRSCVHTRWRERQPCTWTVDVHGRDVRDERDPAHGNRA